MGSGRCSPPSPYFITLMSTVLPSNIDWRQELRYPWTTDEGQAHLNNLVTPLLPFPLRPFQLYDSACILAGQDVFCISATGDGKSALIYIPALARPEMVTIVIEPTNFLESSLVRHICLNIT